MHLVCLGARVSASEVCFTLEASQQQSAPRGAWNQPGELSHTTYQGNAGLPSRYGWQERPVNVTTQNHRPPLTVNQGAEYLQVHPITIRRMIERGELRAFRVGRSIRIDPRELDKLSRRQAVTPTAAYLDDRAELAEQIAADEQKRQTADSLRIARDRQARRLDVDALATTAG